MSSQKTHVLYVAEFSTGGSVESLLTLVNGLDRSAYDATILFYTMPAPATRERLASTGASVIALRPYSPGAEAQPRFRKRNLQARVGRVFGNTAQRFYASVKFLLHLLRFRRAAYRGIRRTIRELKPDLVHLNNGADTDAPGILAARVAGIPAVCHTRTFGRLPHAGVLVSRSVSRFICISSAVRDTLVSQGVAEDRCVVVPNAVDLSRFDSRQVRAAPIRGEFGWDDTAMVFALVGRVVSWKGQDFFIRAIAEARARDPSIRGLIVGDGDSTAASGAFRANLESMIAELGLADAVAFSGHRSDIPEIMKGADVIVCASSQPEPFGRVIIESMAVGTPVIATDAGGARDIITDGVNGLLVPLRDSRALAQAMLRLSRDKGLAARLCQQAEKSVAENYTVRNHVDRVCAIYRGVLEEN